MFNDMIGSIEFDVTRLMMKAQIHEQERPQAERHISTTATRNIAAHQVVLVRNLKTVTVKDNKMR
ncbi:preprotein translocase subunit SecA [Streptococcus pneumoniae]|nr:preprotein translocase subunit SecA [Streptococcus pneumoniae]